MFSSSDRSLPESLSMSDISAVNTFVMEPILNPVFPVGVRPVGSK